MANKPLGTLDMTSNKFITPVYGNSGDHRMHGVMLGRGPELRAGLTVEGAKIVDYAPTILHSLGSPVPADMDGRALEEIFTEEYMRDNPIRLTDAVTDEVRAPESDLSDEESEEIRERLRGWGYLG
jgi:hypothetical protein